MLPTRFPTYIGEPLGRRYVVLRSEFLNYVKDIPIVPERGTASGRALLDGRIVHIPEAFDLIVIATLSDVFMDISDDVDSS